MKLTYDLLDPSAIKAVLGLIVLQADETLENEMRAVFQDPSVRLLHSRIPSGADLNPQTLMQMKEDLPAAASLLPATADFDVIAYACTSGATFIGPDTVKSLITEHHPAAQVTNPISAVLAACSALNIKRLGFITPYVAEVSDTMRTYLEDHGLEIAAFGSFEQMEESVVARISDSSILDALVRVGKDETLDGLFLSCTNLNSFSVIEAAEKITGKPVISSNQALYWHMRKLAKLPISGAGPGMLFS